MKTPLKLGGNLGLRHISRPIKLENLAEDKASCELQFPDLKNEKNG